MSSVCQSGSRAASVWMNTCTLVHETQNETGFAEYVLRRESKAGVIVLSCRDDEAIGLATLESGADDYLTWPYSWLELLAQMRALLRRVGGSKYTIPDLTLGVFGYTI